MAFQERVILLEAACQSAEDELKVAKEAQQQFQDSLAAGQEQIHALQVPIFFNFVEYPSTPYTGLKWALVRMSVLGHLHVYAPQGDSDAEGCCRTDLLADFGKET